jgi:hypothetical protein
VKNPRRMRTLVFHSSNSNRVHRASRVRLGRRKRRVRLPRERRRRVPKVMDRNGVGVFGAGVAVVGAVGRKARRRRRSHAETRGRGEKQPTPRLRVNRPLLRLFRHDQHQCCAADLEF